MSSSARLMLSDVILRGIGAKLCLTPDPLPLTQPRVFPFVVPQLFLIVVLFSARVSTPLAALTRGVFCMSGGASASMS